MQTVKKSSIKATKKYQQAMLELVQLQVRHYNESASGAGVRMDARAEGAAVALPVGNTGITSPSLTVRPTGCSHGE